MQIRSVRDLPNICPRPAHVTINFDDLNISDFDEFLGMMKNKASEADQESDLRDAFKIFDRDNNGYIDMKELKQVGKYRC